MPRIIGKNHTTADPQYDRLLKRVMDTLKEPDEDGVLFWDALEKLRDYASLKDILDKR